MTFFVVRLLQQFDRFELASECQPEGSVPPKVWQERAGRQRVEKIWPAAALTLFVKVRENLGFIRYTLADSLFFFF
jgi:hypothetical protein